MKYLDAQAHRLEQEAKRARKIAGRKATAGPPENKALPGPAENKAETAATSTLAFASPQAEKLAKPLSPEAFADIEPSSEYGFTVADVRRAAGE